MTKTDTAKPDKKRTQVQTIAERKADNLERTFHERLMSLLNAAMDMLQAQAETASEKDFIKKDPNGAVQIGEFVIERADRIAERMADRLRRSDEGQSHSLPGPVNTERGVDSVRDAAEIVGED